MICWIWIINYANEKIGHDHSNSLNLYLFFKMINTLIKRSLFRYCSIRNSTPKRYLSSENGDVFKLQERGFFCDNLSETEFVLFHMNLYFEIKKLINWYSSNNIRKLVTSGKQSIYCGFDPTAKSLHIGNLVGMLICLFRFILFKCKN